MKLTLKHGNIYIAEDGLQKMEVRNWYLDPDHTDPLTITSTNGNYDFENQNEKVVPKEITLLEMKWCHSADPVLPKPSEFNEVFWGKHKISREMLSEALDVCQETYIGSYDEPGRK